MRRCPACKGQKHPSFAILSRQYSARALALPYFLCGDCRTIYIDKNFVRECISSWRKSSKDAMKRPFKKFYQEAMQYLEGIINQYIQDLGYRRATFKKPTSVPE